MKKIWLLLALCISIAAGTAFLPGNSLAASAQSAPEASVPLSGKVNINTADEATLSSLPGIGPKTAAAIVSYRKEHGNFGSIADLQQVKGIGSKKLAKIEPYLEKI